MTEKIVRKRSRIHGNGVFATTRIRKGEEVVEYKGKLCTHTDVDEKYGGLDSGHTFLFTLNDSYVIDANVRGNVAKWINHSCAPNGQAFVIGHAGGDPRKDRVVVEALRDIGPGEEITYDYGITVDEPISAEERRLWACHCGAPTCRGSLLTYVPPVRKRTKVARRHAA